VAKERKLSEEKVKALVDKKINLPATMGTATVNVLELNIALDEL
jgi:K+-transporting ATPase ATPase C chain